MQVTSIRGHRGVPKCGLHKMDWASSLKRVTGVGMPQPVGAHGRLDPSPARSGANYAKNLRMAKGSTFARSEDGGSGIAIAI